MGRNDQRGPGIGLLYYGHWLTKKREFREGACTNDRTA